MPRTLESLTLLEGVRRDWRSRLVRHEFGSELEAVAFVMGRLALGEVVTIEVACIVWKESTDG